MAERRAYQVIDSSRVWRLANGPLRQIQQDEKEDDMPRQDWRDDDFMTRGRDYRDFDEKDRGSDRAFFGGERDEPRMRRRSGS